MVCSGTPFVPVAAPQIRSSTAKRKKKKIERVQDSRPLSVGGARRRELKCQKITKEKSSTKKKEAKQSKTKTHHPANLENATSGGGETFWGQRT
jgi:hypothetical protein